MNIWRFTLLTFAGSFPWSLGLIWAGYTLGDNWEDLTGYFRPVSLPIALGVVVLAAVFLYRRIKEVSRDHRESQAAAQSSADPE